MAATYYASVTVNPSDLSQAAAYFNSGTASTATDIMELRIGNGTYAPTRAEVIKFLELMERWVIQGGLDQAGANVPLPTGKA